MKKVNYDKIRQEVKDDLGIDIHGMSANEMYQASNGKVQRRKHREDEGGGCFSSGTRITYKDKFYQ